MNYVLKIAYDGTAYHGWQRQKNGITVQEVMESTLEKLLGAPTAGHGLLSDGRRRSCTDICLQFSRGNNHSRRKAADCT